MKHKEALQLYEEGYRSGATCVLKHLDKLIPSYLTDVWKRELQSKLNELKEIWQKRK
uniref:Uncharacterized protein n=1 Tax=viral metagenome TaxID=1070528 RepID=A0A6H1ZW67_9ZZZZ